MRPLTPSRFKKPEAFLSGIDAQIAGDLVSAACDVTIAVDADGIVLDVALGSSDLPIEGMADWVGQPVDDCVTPESLPKLRQLLDSSDQGQRWRQVNHPTPSGEDVPVQYIAVPAPYGEGFLLLGREMRSLAQLQSRLVGTQQSLERDYARLRQLETRYQMLFRTAVEGLLVIDAASGRILEVNPAAVRLLGASEKELTRHRFPLGLDDESRDAARQMISALRTTGRAESLPVQSEDGTPLVLEAGLFRGEQAQLALISLSPGGNEPQSGSDVDRRVISLVNRAAEGVVLTNSAGEILWANDAFLDLVQAAVGEQVRGESLDRYFARPGVDLSVMLANAQEHGRLRFFATSVSGTYGGTSEVDVSTVALRDGGLDGFGFILRSAAHGASRDSREGTPMPRSVEQLKALIGRMPLREIVRETTDVIERLCIQTALHMTRDNRASAADLLGLSRQSLYVKLRRHGLGDLDPELPS